MPSRASIKTIKATGTRSQASGGMWLWAQGWDLAVASIHHALTGPVDGQGIVFWHLHADARSLSYILCQGVMRYTSDTFPRQGPDKGIPSLRLYFLWCLHWQSIRI